MALSDRPVVARLVEAAEERLGVTVRPVEQVQALEESSRRFGEFREEAIELAYHSLDYLGGRPHELQPEARRRLAQRSRIALMRDPLAGAEAAHLANFSFGKGVGRPQADDEAVQAAIDSAWTDPNNTDKLTSPFALRKLSNDLITQGEFFLTMYESGGHVRVGRLDADAVEHVVPDEPDDRLRPLYYMVRPRRVKWDYKQDRLDAQTTVLDSGQMEVRYHPHWRNVEDAKRERELDPEAEPLNQPPAKKLGRGVVYHVAINQTGENLRGNPPWQRSLRFYSAMNAFTEARVAMAQGAASFIAKRVVQGGPKAVTQAATSILTQTGELGAGLLGRSGADPIPDVDGVGTGTAFPAGGRPPDPGSWWNENEASKLESLRLDSGASAAAQDSQIIRAPLAATSGFGQHYLGDASNANLATATSLELPALMTVSWWQEVFEQTLRWFTDRAIEAKVRSGALGGASEGSPGQPLTELRLQEAEDKAEMEQRTSKKLDYEFTMPYPGRRNLPDVTALTTGVAEAFDPDGTNKPLREVLLRFLFTHGLELEDPAKAVEKVIAAAKPFEKPEPPLLPGVDPADPEGKRKPGDPPGERPARARQGVPKPGDADPRRAGTVPAQESAWIPAELASVVSDLGDGTEEAFRELVSDPAAAAALGMELVSANGSG